MRCLIELTLHKGGGSTRNKREKEEEAEDNEKRHVRLNEVDVFV